MVVVVELFDDLDAVAAAYEDALDREPQLFDRLGWFRLTTEHCPPAGTPLVVRASEGVRQGWLFLARRGSRAEALASWYTLRFDAVGCGDDDLLAAMADSLRRRGISRVELYPLLADAALMRWRGRGWAVSAQAASRSWRIATAGMTFADYWRQRPSRLRNTAERKAKAAALEIAVHSRFDADAWASYEAVYRASWKPEEGSIAFLRALAEQEGAAGRLRLGIASSGGTPVAAQLWLVENGIATIHKLAYAEAAKKLSPGTILSMAMFRHALDVDRVRAIDFGLGDDAYKADWMGESVPVYRFAAFNLRTIDGFLGVARAAAAKLVRGSRSD